MIDKGARDIALEIGAKKEDVAAILRRKLLQAKTDDEEISQFSYRAEEYDALSGALRVHDSKYDGDFVREGTDIASYGLPFLKSISLITKVREVIALTGFTRINPQESGFNADKSGSFVPINAFLDRGVVVGTTGTSRTPRRKLASDLNAIALIPRAQ